MKKTKSNRSRYSNMNILFSKDKSIMENAQSNSETSLAFASGDCFVPEPRCKLCSGVVQLKKISTDHYNKVLGRIFDVEVPDTGNICEACVKCLKVCERFQILVNSTFVKKTRFTGPSCDQSTETERFEVPTNSHKEIIDLLTASLTSSKSKKKRQKTTNHPPNSLAKRINIACTICQHKYLMLDQGINNNFTCSRCKRNELKIDEGKKNSSLPANGLRSQNNLTGKYRLDPVQKTPPTQCLRSRTKNQCALCPKSYVDPLHLAMHVKTMHGPCYVCCVCGKRTRNKEVYENHLKLHPCSKIVSTLP